MFLIIGLGNPEKKYRYTRHNAGFLALDVFAERHKMQFIKQAHKALISEGRIANEKIVLAKPLTYMNLSGQAVVELANWYKLDIESDMVVLYDDIDLNIGTIRVRSKGSAGTHNGMKSIIHLTGKNSFARVRIGVGAKKQGWDLANYVLSSFEEQEKQPFWDSLKDASLAVEMIINNELSEAQRAFNKKSVIENQTQTKDLS